MPPAVLRVLLLPLFLPFFSPRTLVLLFAAFPLRMLAEVVVTVEIHLETVLLWNPLLLEETASQRLDAPAESLMMKPSPLTNRVFFVAHEDS